MMQPGTQAFRNREHLQHCGGCCTDTGSLHYTGRPSSEDGRQQMASKDGHSWLDCFLVDNQTDMKECVRAAFAKGNQMLHIHPLKISGGGAAGHMCPEYQRAHSNFHITLKSFKLWSCGHEHRENAQCYVWS